MLLARRATNARPSAGGDLCVRVVVVVVPQSALLEIRRFIPGGWWWPPLCLMISTIDDELRLCVCVLVLVLCSEWPNIRCQSQCREREKETCLFFAIIKCIIKMMVILVHSVVKRL